MFLSFSRRYILALRCENSSSFSLSPRLGTVTPRGKQRGFGQERNHHLPGQFTGDPFAHLPDGMGKDRASSSSAPRENSAVKVLTTAPALIRTKLQ